MTEKVFIHIAGQHTEAGNFATGTEHEALETEAPARYYRKNGKHYIIYDEAVEGFPEPIKNTIKITGTERIEIRKKGLIDTAMTFEKGRRVRSDYRTPYLQMQVETETRELEIEIRETLLRVMIRYHLLINGEMLSDCRLHLSVAEEENRKGYS